MLLAMSSKGGATKRRFSFFMFQSRFTPPAVGLLTNSAVDTLTYAGTGILTNVAVGGVLMTRPAMKALCNTFWLKTVFLNDGAS